MGRSEEIKKKLSKLKLVQFENNFKVITLHLISKIVINQKENSFLCFALLFFFFVLNNINAQTIRYTGRSFC